jgi:Protein of unknown function (DUF559)
MSTRVPAELTKGPFTIAEAWQAGVTWKQLQGRAWRRLDGGIYVSAALPASPLVRMEGVFRRMPEGAAFSGLTAAWLHGLDVQPCDPVEVTIPDSCGISTLDGASIRRAALAGSDVVRLRGLPATSALRTLTELGRYLPLVEAVVIADMALHSGLVQLPELRARVATHPPRKGIAQLRQVVDLAEPAAESPMETRLRLHLVLAGLPRPLAQVPLLDERGRFLGRPDLYYPTRRLCLEYDGGTHRDSMTDDNRRQNRLVNAGYRLLRYTHADTPERIVRETREALGVLAPNRPVRGRRAGALAPKRPRRAA